MKFSLSRVTRVKPATMFWLGVIALVSLLIPHTSFALGFGGLAFAGAIMDSRAEFCDATALSTAGTGLALVGNVMDISVVRDLGNGRPVYLVISCDTTITSAGAATLGFVVASDAQAAIAVDGTATEHLRTQLIAKATWVAGFQQIVELPPEFPAYEQFLGILQNVGVAALTAGKINAYLTLDPPRWKAYKNDPNIA